jgi:hypothetical protein
VPALLVPVPALMKKGNHRGLPLRTKTGNHVTEEGNHGGVAPTGRGLSLGDVVQRFKSLTTKRYSDGVRQHGWLAFPGRLWQRNYFEHIIRNDHALDQIRLYIMNNPANWMLDRENPEAECYGRDDGQP